MIKVRNDGRTYDQVRSLKITSDPFGYADASVLFELGQTKVLVGVTMQNGVPRFLKGRGTGWLTAEYAMLPSSTRQRMTRESYMQKRNGRSVEISRLIGRCFRCVVDLDLIGERTITIDCDVLQADGGTRGACISAAGIALQIAVTRWLREGVLRKNCIKDSIAAVSVGIVQGKIYLDLCQEEDNHTQVDFNFILTKCGNIVELQGTSEKAPMSWENFGELKKLALRGVSHIFDASAKLLAHNQDVLDFNASSKKTPLFSLANRVDLQKTQKT